MTFVQRAALTYCLAVALLVISGCDDEDKKQSENEVNTESDSVINGDDVSSSGINAKTDARTGDDDAEISDDDASNSETGSDLTVQLTDGVVEGDVVGGARQFLKIPYAKPPVGDLRWKAPQKNLSWTGIRHETEFSQPCAQNGITGWVPASENEDCLYLNVWAPLPATTKAAVMVFIHGGGNYSGSADDRLPGRGPGAGSLWYDGQFFASNHGIVVVTFNYRLGPFGFLAHDKIESEGSPFGNQGLFDQLAVFQWVQDNIDKFGGDPGNVTIFGESAGSHDVCYHIASPLSRGLFHRAISESGGCTVSLLGGAQLTATEDALLHEGFIQALECDTATDELACMRAKTSTEILAAAGELNPGRKPDDQPWTFGAVVDGPGGFLPDQPRAIYDRKEVAQVPYIIGSNTEEGTLFLIGADEFTDEANYQERLEARYGDNAEDVAALYPLSKFDGDFRAAMARAVGDEVLVCTTYDTALRAAQAGLDVHMYNFNVSWDIGSTWIGAAHASEIQFVFGNLTDPTPDKKKVSDAMNTFWATFAKTGVPDYEGEPVTWPAFVSDNGEPEKRLQFDPNFEILDNFREEECAYWRSQYDEGFETP